ncbi:MAG TPA: GNAT family N-acetyltransferase, partial [Gemmatimonadaceae bacterium]
EKNFTLRYATADDAASVAGLLSELGHPTSASDIPDRLAGLVREGGAVLLATDPSGSPLGVMSLTRLTTLHSIGPVAYITALVTTSAARRRGVGRAFISAAKEWARDNGCARITVTSAERRADAHAFYPACGLPYTGRRFSTALDAAD